MLKKDFDGYLEFVQKVQEADNEEMEKLCIERTQLYVDKIQDVIGVAPSGDLAFVITALRIIAEAAQKLEPEATRMAQKLFDEMSCSSKLKSSCTGIHEPGFRHLRQLQYNKYNTQAAECQFRQE